MFGEISFIATCFFFSISNGEWKYGKWIRMAVQPPLPTRKSAVILFQPTWIITAPPSSVPCVWFTYLTLLSSRMSKEHLVSYLTVSFPTLTNAGQGRWDNLGGSFKYMAPCQLPQLQQACLLGIRFYSLKTFSALADIYAETWWRFSILFHRPFWLTYFQTLPVSLSPQGS